MVPPRCPECWQRWAGNGSAPLVADRILTQISHARADVWRCERQQWPPERAAVDALEHAATSARVDRPRVQRVDRDSLRPWPLGRMWGRQTVAAVTPILASVRALEDAAPEARVQDLRVTRLDGQCPCCRGRVPRGGFPALACVRAPEETSLGAEIHTPRLPRVDRDRPDETLESVADARLGQTVVCGPPVRSSIRGLEDPGTRACIHRRRSVRIDRERQRPLAMVEAQHSTPRRTAVATLEHGVLGTGVQDPWVRRLHGELDDVVPREPPGPAVCSVDAFEDARFRRDVDSSRPRWVENDIEDDGPA